MKGWIDGKDVPNYYFEADIGINIDKDIYEVKLAAKAEYLIGCELAYVFYHQMFVS